MVGRKKIEGNCQAGLCGLPLYAKGFCRKHYAQSRRKSKPKVEAEAVVQVASAVVEGEVKTEVKE